MSSSNCSRSIVLRLLQQHLHSSSSSSCSSVPRAVALGSCHANRIPHPSSSRYVTSDTTAGPCSSSSWRRSNCPGNSNSTGHRQHEHADAVEPQGGCRSHSSTNIRSTISTSGSNSSSSSRWGQQQGQHVHVLQQLSMAPQWPLSRAAASLLHSGKSSSSSGSSKGKCTAAITTTTGSSSGRGIFSSSSSSSSSRIILTSSSSRGISSSSSSSRGISSSTAVPNSASGNAAGDASSSKASSSSSSSSSSKASSSSSSSSSSKASSSREAKLEEFKRGTTKDVERMKKVQEAHTFQPGQMLDGDRYLLGACRSFIAIRPAGCWQSTWVGLDLEAGTLVTLKCIEAGDAARYTKGMREAALHAVLGSCPNIAGLRDAFEHRDKAGRHPVMVFDKPTASLAEVIHSYVPPPAYTSMQNQELHGICDQPWVLKKLAKDLLTALDHLHSRGLVHLALLPSRVVLDKPFKSAINSSESTIWQAAKKVWRHSMAAASDPGDIPTEWSETCLYRATFKVGDLSSAVTYANWDNLQRAGGLPVQAAPAAAAAAAGAAALNAGARTALTFRDIQVAGEQNVKSPLLLVPSELDLYMHFQPPEALLGMPHIAPSYDMWQFGCLMAYTATMEKPFDSTIADAPKARSFNYGRDHWILGAMVERLGHMPRGYGRTSPKRSEFFHQGSGYDTWDYLQLHAGPLKPLAGQAPIYQFLLEETTLYNEYFGQNNAKPFADFLNEVLCWEPSSRASAKDLLKHPWLQDAAVDSN